MVSTKAEAVRTNWSGNYEYQARELHEPRSTAELQQVVARAERIRALGSRHSFNGIADSNGEQISLARFQGMELDEAAETVTVGGGVTYAQLAPWLHNRGYALQNLASLLPITVAGAVQTGSHGSGLGLGSLATAVVAIDLVTAGGDLLRVSREEHGTEFDGMVVALGSLGMAASLVLSVEPAYLISQRVYERLPLATLKTHLRQLFASGYSVSLFTDWRPETVSQVWIKSRVEPGSEADSEGLLHSLNARPATQNLIPVQGSDPQLCTPQMGVPGPWCERLPHFRDGALSGSGDELQTEYFVGFEQGWDAIEAVGRLRGRIQPLLSISELRAVQADSLWLSPAYKRESLTIQFTWKPDWPGVRAVLPALEEALAPFGARPHWAKVSACEQSAVAALYPRMERFRDLRREFDPKNKFCNATTKHLD